MFAKLCKANIHFRLLEFHNLMNDPFKNQTIQMHDKLSICSTQSQWRSIHFSFFVVHTYTANLRVNM